MLRREPVFGYKTFGRTEALLQLQNMSSTSSIRFLVVVALCCLQVLTFFVFINLRAFDHFNQYSEITDRSGESGSQETGY